MATDTTPQNPTPAEAKLREKPKFTEWISSIAQLLAVLTAIIAGYMVYSTGVIDAKRAQFTADTTKAENELHVKRKELADEKDALKKAKAEYEALKQRLETLELEDQGIQGLAKMVAKKELRVSYKVDEKLRIIVDFYRGQDGKPPSMPEAIKYANSIRSLNGMSFTGMRLSEEELALAMKRDIPDLSLISCEVTNRALSKLTPPSSLKILELSFNKITSFSAMDPLTSVHSLDVSHNPIDDDGVASIVKAFPNVKNLFLWSTKISDVGVARLTKLPRLQSLDLNGTKVTDDGMAILAGMPSLQAVRLDDTNVTQNGLARLAASKSLLAVHLGTRKATPVLLQAMKNAGARFLISQTPEFRFRDEGFPSWNDFRLIP